MEPPGAGNKQVKRVSFLSRIRSAQGPDLTRAYYDRKRAEGKKRNAALIGPARRRCDVIFAMLRDRKPYQPRPATA